MTLEELHEFLKRLSIYLYECDSATSIDRDTQREYTVSEREILALACGINCADVFTQLKPKKPVSEMTEEDIANIAIECTSTLFETYTRAGVQEC